MSVNIYIYSTYSKVISTSKSSNLRAVGSRLIIRPILIYHKWNGIILYKANKWNARLMYEDYISKVYKFA